MAPRAGGLDGGLDGASRLPMRRRRVCGRDCVQAGRVIAASAPPSATPDAVAQMFGQVLAASSLVEDADKSLGPPSVWQ